MQLQLNRKAALVKTTSNCGGLKSVAALPWRIWFYFKSVFSEKV